MGRHIHIHWGGKVKLHSAYYEGKLQNKSIFTYLNIPIIKHSFLVFQYYSNAPQQENKNHKTKNTPQKIHQALAFRSSFSKEQTQKTDETLLLSCVPTLNKVHI